MEFSNICILISKIIKHEPLYYDSFNSDLLQLFNFDFESNFENIS